MSLTMRAYGLMLTFLAFPLAGSCDSGSPSHDAAIDSSQDSVAVDASARRDTRDAVDGATFPDTHLQDDGGSRCGDGFCENQERCGCPDDCPAGRCGDGLCCSAEGETEASCLDCSCGNGRCDLALESSESCGDCRCGDGVCHPEEETRVSCPGDCGPAFDRIDWLVQDRVIADPSMDPYCVPNSAREEQDAFSPIHFLLLDPLGHQNFTSFRVRAFHDQTRWTDRAMTTFDFPPHFESQRVSSGPGVYGGDTMESDGPLVSIVGTNDSGGTTGWFNNTGAHACSYGDAWVLYDKNNVPISDGLGSVNWSPELRTAITGVTAPSTSNCPSARGTSRTRWTYYPAFAYASSASCTGEAHKQIHTIVADHGPGNLNHHEVFYLTDEYGLTRWERWNCFADRQMEPPSPDYAARRCNYAQSESVMHMAYPVAEAPEQGWQIRNREGRYCVLTDCRDTTHFRNIDDPAGWIPAGWPMGAQVYFSGNLLQNNDFALGDEGAAPPSWTVQGTMRSTTVVDDDESHQAMLETGASGHGWFSQVVSLDGFTAALGAGVDSAGSLRIRFGATVRAPGTPSIQVAIVQWNGSLSENYGVSIDSFLLGPDTQHIAGQVDLDSRTRRVEIRLSLGPSESARVDDAYVLIAD